MTDHTRIEKIGGDSIIFVVIQVEREIVMTEELSRSRLKMYGFIAIININLKRLWM